MKALDIVKIAINPAYYLLPDDMATQQATTMLLAIGMQESQFKYRQQMNGGPAQGFWQFEISGVRGVMEHPATRGIAADILGFLVYPADAGQVHAALQDNDVLAATFARLYLWTDPRPLPVSAQDGWSYYLDIWRPGDPHPETWNAAWAAASHAYA